MRTRSIPIALFAATLLVAPALAADSHTSGPFAGSKADTGTVTHAKQGGRSILTLSEDFKVPDTPDPHWQLVDAKGRTYLLQRLPIKGDKVNRSIEVPAYVPDVAKVQIWCAYAETLLGEASFAKPVKKARTIEGAHRRLPRTSPVSTGHASASRTSVRETSAEGAL